MRWSLKYVFQSLAQHGPCCDHRETRWEIQISLFQTENRNHDLVITTLCFHWHIKCGASDDFTKENRSRGPVKANALKLELISFFEMSKLNINKYRLIQLESNSLVGCSCRRQIVYFGEFKWIAICPESKSWCASFVAYFLRAYIFVAHYVCDVCERQQRESDCVCVRTKLIACMCSLSISRSGIGKVFGASGRERSRFTEGARVDAKRSPSGDR